MVYSHNYTTGFFFKWKEWALLQSSMLYYKANTSQWAQQAEIQETPNGLRKESSNRAHLIFPAALFQDTE